MSRFFRFEPTAAYFKSVSLKADRDLRTATSDLLSTETYHQTSTLMADAMEARAVLFIAQSVVALTDRAAERDGGIVPGLKTQAEIVAAVAEAQPVRNPLSRSTSVMSNLWEDMLESVKAEIREHLEGKR